MAVVVLRLLHDNGAPFHVAVDRLVAHGAEESSVNDLATLSLRSNGLGISARAQLGVKRVALGYYQAMVGRATPGRKKTLELFRRKIEFPSLALTGALDGCRDRRLYDVAMKEEDFPGEIEVVRVEEAGHFLHPKRAQEISRILIDCLNDGRQRAAA